VKSHVGGDIPLLNPRDLNFLLYEWLDVESLCQRARFAEHSATTFDAVLDLAADIAVQMFAPHNKLADAHEITVAADGSIDTIPETKKALDAVGAAGLLAGEFDGDLGGMQLPYVVSKAAGVWLQAANISTSAYAALTIANAHLLARYGTENQIDTWVRPMLEGRYFGTMCLSEPESGSSLADITTRAVRQDDGTYGLTGTKMWISGGDHDLSENIVHLVLAKTPGGPAGVKGISLFIVPKHLHAEGGTIRNDVVLAGLNHKMGNRGTTNALLSLGDGTFVPNGRAGAVGYLVGEEGAGLAQMFHMMNEARIGVGLSATALGYTGYLQSLAYARVRVQGRAVAARKAAEPLSPVPIIAHPDVRRMLMAQKSYAEGSLALGLYAARLLDDVATAEDETARENARLLLEVLTPIVKSWPSQWCLEANNLAIQVHGGYGYTCDFNVEQLYRDNRLNSIHEGTHAIHGLDLLGRKVTMGGGSGLRVLLEAMTATITRAEHSDDNELHGWAAALRRSVARVAEVTGRLWGTGDPETALANSTAYLEGVGHVVLAWIWLEQALAADGKPGNFYDGKRAAARYFFTYELPKTAAQFDLLASLDRSLIDLSEKWF
jgi:alkylation response protein AidB-like acyl-CoA dehydrogenase